MSLILTKWRRKLRAPPKLRQSIPGPVGMGHLTKYTLFAAKTTTATSPGVDGWLLYTAVQSRKAVTAYFSSEQLLPSGFAKKY